MFPIQCPTFISHDGVHSWLLFVHTLECNEKLFVLHPLTLIYFTRQNFTQKKNKMKKEWIEFEIQLCTHASERAQGVEGTHANKLARPGLLWSGHKALRQLVIDHVKGWATLRTKLMRKVALVPSPLSYQFFLSSHSLLFIALQLICLVLNGAEQTWWAE